MADKFANEIAEVALALHEEPSVDERLDRLLDVTLKAVDCTYAGVLFAHRGRRFEVAAATDPIVHRIAEFEAAGDDGPSRDVLWERRSLLVDDTRTEPRWPGWGRALDGLGVRSFLGCRLYTSSETVGTLNMYAVTPGAFDVDDQAVGHVLARHAAVALASAREAENLWQAIDARKLIGQAQGILMERYDLDPDRAFSVLLRYSQQNNVKLRTVAERLVSTRRLPESD